MMKLKNIKLSILIVLIISASTFLGVALSYTEASQINPDDYAPTRTELTKMPVSEQAKEEVKPQINPIPVYVYTPVQEKANNAQPAPEESKTQEPVSAPKTTVLPEQVIEPELIQVPQTSEIKPDPINEINNNPPKINQGFTPLEKLIKEFFTKNKYKTDL